MVYSTLHQVSLQLALLVPYLDLPFLSLVEGGLLPG